MTDPRFSRLQSTLDDLIATHDLPACHVALADANALLFQGCAGAFDPLEGKNGRKASNDDVLWFASTTKLITSVGKCLG